jgi:hypothetical protein
MVYATEMGSCAITYISSFIKTGSGIQKLIKEGFIDSMVVQAYFHFISK